MIFDNCGRLIGWYIMFRQVAHKLGKFFALEGGMFLIAPRTLEVIAKFIVVRLFVIFCKCQDTERFVANPPVRALSLDCSRVRYACRLSPWLVKMKLFRELSFRLPLHLCDFAIGWHGSIHPELVETIATSTSHQDALPQAFPSSFSRCSQPPVTMNGYSDQRPQDSIMQPLLKR
ncbi:hypothetical protein BDP67DRAFT_493916 [Colletotrichum lupini]|nr:hypothetical protein BDP67DRAFT_493916 [Colletotrichum lupini]